MAVNITNRQPWTPMKKALFISALLVTISSVAVFSVILTNQDTSPPPTKAIGESPPKVTTTSTTSTTTTTMPATTTTTIGPQRKLELELAAIDVPTYPEIACAWIERLGSNKYLDRAEGLCLPIANAYLDLISGRYGIPEQLENLPPAPGDEFFVLEFFTQDVVHMVYVMSFESGGDPLANGRNWGCPNQKAIRALHPDPDGRGPDGRRNCPWTQGKVPISYVSHMAHTLEDRSNRTLGFLIDPYDLYESALLGYALVFETGGNGWYHWWHIHWGLNAYLTPLGIQGVYHCPPGPYWQNVKGGEQVCPYA